LRIHTNERESKAGDGAYDQGGRQRDPSDSQSSRRRDRARNPVTYYVLAKCLPIRLKFGLRGGALTRNLLFALLKIQSRLGLTLMIVMHFDPPESTSRDVSSGR
jgi:hypothetical protein